MDCERCKDEDKSVGTTDIPIQIYICTNLYLY